MGSRSKDSNGIRPTRPPSGPALVRPTIGVLVLALGGTVGMSCKPHGDPPMSPPPMPNPGNGGPPPMPNPTYEPPMDPPPEPPSTTDDGGTPIEAPMSPPVAAPMPPPEPSQTEEVLGWPPMPNPGPRGKAGPEDG